MEEKKFNKNFIEYTFLKITTNSKMPILQI